jgi:rare lipoprotein A (peptidoglycan hydrolase)
MGISAFFTRSRHATAVLALASAALGTQALAPAAYGRAAHDGSGGAGLSGSGSAPTAGSSTGETSTDTTTTGPSSTGTTVAGVTVTGAVLGMTNPLQASGDGITLTLADYGTIHQELRLTGSAPVAEAGATIDIEVAPTSGIPSWSQVTSATVASNGTFSSVWVPTQSTTVELKAVLATALAPAPAGTATSSTGGGALPGADADTATAAATQTLSSTGAVMLPIFKDAITTFYGPGLWGRRTACGEVLQRATVGIASRTLKCGTMVAVQYGGRELSLPVIDRGPFANHASWDLTMAAARLLRLRETATVGTLAPAPASLLSAVRGHR